MILKKFPEIYFSNTFRDIFQRWLIFDRKFFPSLPQLLPHSYPYLLSTLWYKLSRTLQELLNLAENPKIQQFRVKTFLKKSKKFTLKKFPAKKIQKTV